MACSPFTVSFSKLSLFSGTVLGFEKPLTYLEKDGCTMTICAKVYLNDIVSPYDSQIHVLDYLVTSELGNEN